MLKNRVGRRLRFAVLQHVCCLCGSCIVYRSEVLVRWSFVFKIFLFGSFFLFFFLSWSAQEVDASSW